jgi:hypothetical protein
VLYNSRPDCGPARQAWDCLCLLYKIQPKQMEITGAVCRVWYKGAGGALRVIGKRADLLCSFPSEDQPELRAKLEKVRDHGSRRGMPKAAKRQSSDESQFIDSEIKRLTRKLEQLRATLETTL